MYLDKAKKLFEESNVVAPDSFKPCTEEEVRALEERAGRPLPEVYKEFLLWMGHGAGGFLAGTHCLYEHLPDIQEGAVELLEENTFPEPLPDDAFVFLMHQGYQFMFFRLSEGDDPPVYYYHESVHKTAFERRFDHFSQVLMLEAEDFVRERSK